MICAGSGATRGLPRADAKRGEVARSFSTRDGTMDQQRLGGAVPRTFSAAQAAEPAVRADPEQGIDL
jgi:hypothetical protein